MWRSIRRTSKATGSEGDCTLMKGQQSNVELHEIPFDQRKIPHISSARK